MLPVGRNVFIRFNFQFGKINDTERFHFPDWITLAVRLALQGDAAKTVSKCTAVVHFCEQLFQFYSSRVSPLMSGPISLPNICFNILYEFGVFAKLCFEVFKILSRCEILPSHLQILAEISPDPCAHGNYKKLN